MLCWGSSALGQLGLAVPEAAVFEPRSCCVFDGRGLKEAACGGQHSLFLMHDGSVYTCGSNSHGQLGHERPGGKPELVGALDAQKIAGVACGQAHSLALSEQGQVFAWGAGEWGQLGLGTAEEAVRVPRLIKKFCEHQISQVMCGNQHCIALSKDGQLFTWGQNSSGQLGLGKDEPSSRSPQPLKSLCGIPLAQISAGGDHSFALSLSGAVFGWGRNSAGQLGLGHKDDMYIPACVSKLSQKKTISISCGEEHTATLSKGGTVFTFGSGRYGQLGHNSFTDELQPRVVTALWGLNVSQVTCGRNHTLALVESSNTIYSFGCGEQGQLGNGQRTNQCVPLPVQLPPEADDNHTVEIIVAGGDQSFVWCCPKNSDRHLEPNPRRGIVMLEDKMIHRWVSKCESKEWRTIKKEIKRVFSSLACINGSFIIKSRDEHYRTSTRFSGLDLESVKNTFERLAKKERALLEIEKTVENDLLPSLSFCAAGVEALRIFLILPELLRVLRHETKITALYASAILSLDPSTREALVNIWSELPETFLKTIVELFHTLATKMISKLTYDYRQKPVLDTPLHKSVQVLQMLHKASCRNQRELTSANFIIYEINELFDMVHALQTGINDVLGCWVWGGDITVMQAEKQKHMHTLGILKSCPCIFPLEAKYNLLKFRDCRGPFRMELRRNALLEDCFRCLRAASEQTLKGWMQVVYCENHETSDVNKRDFFHKAFKILLESQMFMYNDTNTLIWFPPEPSLPDETYFLLGLLCGLAFYNNCVVNMPFPLALFKKLLNIRPSLEDFAELSPVIAQSLQYLLNYSDDDAENMEMTYTVVWNNKEVELDPSEPDKVVTSSNKNLFVNSYMDYVLNRSVERVFNEFKRGFYKVCDKKLVNFFQPDELRGVMLGSEEYDWDTFKKNATYENGFHAKHPTIVSFWEAFEELSSQDKKGFLLFVTGFDRVPILGMGQVRMRVRPFFNSTEDHLPHALTCHTLLDLPVYQSKEILQTKLVEAIHHRRGFWED